MKVKYYDNFHQTRTKIDKNDNHKLLHTLHIKYEVIFSCWMAMIRCHLLQLTSLVVNGGCK